MKAQQGQVKGWGKSRDIENMIIVLHQSLQHCFPSIAINIGGNNGHCVTAPPLTFLTASQNGCCHLPPSITSPLPGCWLLASQVLTGRAAAAADLVTVLRPSRQTAPVSPSPACRPQSSPRPALLPGRYYQAVSAPKPHRPNQRSNQPPYSALCSTVQYSATDDSTVQ